MLSRAQLVFKRALDLALGSLAFLLLLPPMLVIGLAVRLCIGSPALFRQTRAGKDGRPFELIKFRSMSDTRDAHGALLPDGERLNSFGRLLRSSSLDELPQLWNVIRGEMSLVGPRPLLMIYLSRYTPEQSRRHLVKPGITGWTQVSGRNALAWEKKFELDVWYVEHASCRLDLYILWRTVLKVVRRDGIHEEGLATASEFMGRRQDCQ